MAEGGGGEPERVSISDAVKSYKKYGSIMNSTKKQELLVKHVVTPGETLQGIALKYGVTMEQIRRVNKIWANDSLFLRETLHIPIPSSNPELCSLTNTNGVSPTASDSEATASGFTERLNDGNQCDKSNQTIADILVRIDSSIAQTRNQVERREKLQDQHYPDDGLPRVKQCFNHHSRMRQSLQSAHSSDNVVNVTDSRLTLQPVVMAQGKRVKSSLQRLQQQQDEIFEL
ncbi:hypothetical protein CHUAL_010266 [Chamberlinius hualienensis]